jgi:hypothetical protein
MPLLKAPAPNNLVKQNAYTLLKQPSKALCSALYKPLHILFLAA